MRFLLRKCPQCRAYTLSDSCSKCGERTITSHPAKFSPEDRYIKYRRAPSRDTAS